MLTNVLRTVLKTLLALLALSILLALLLRWVNPPFSALMLERQWAATLTGENYHSKRSWLAWPALPDNLKMAVIAGEDQQFADHYGFDIAAIRAALAHNQDSESIRGASTLSQQVAKNTFLWSSRSWSRKALEAWFTLWIELFWSKERILEVYLNSAEWGPGIFGAQAAAQYHFQRNAAQLDNQQAYLLAAILPSPLQRSASQPSAATAQRANWIARQVRQLGGNHYLKALKASDSD
ncbi:MAG: monofunctional biosynthetic peptidoglycan transglycosylase [Pseudomonas sp.]|nr:monofunctional biosynthetic peptidoglycan transglycosylase [Pseudomonas sp.]